MKEARISTTAATLLFAMTVLLSGAGVGTVCAQTDAQMELTEARTALQAALAKVAALEKRAAVVEEANRTIGESLAAANAESRQFQESYRELRLQVDALGIELIQPGSTGIEQRLLNAVNDIRILEEEKRQLEEQLIELSEVTMSFMKTAVSPGVEERMVVEAQLRAANHVLGMGPAPRSEQVRSVEEATVIDMKPEYGLLVLDAGEGSGARVGTPLQVVRKDRVIATALVIDVRGHISGAVVQRLVQDGDEVRAGDRIRVRSQQDF